MTDTEKQDIDPKEYMKMMRIWKVKQWLKRKEKFNMISVTGFQQDQQLKGGWKLEQY